MPEHRRPDPFILTALTMIVVVTVGWWAAALWPLPEGTPDWVVRARAACFGSNANGAPNSGGWILLVGTPVTMLGALLVIAPRETRRTIELFYHSRQGFLVLGATVAGLMVLLLMAIGRVGSLYGFGLQDVTRPTVTVVPELGTRISRWAPPLDLTDHRGARFSLAALAGRPAIVTFAYGKCETVCPVVVHNALAARELALEFDPAVVVVTLDPWRDTLARLPHIAESWGLTGDAYLLGGPVNEVEATLDTWGIERQREERTGEIAHPAVAYVLDREGRIAFVTSGATDQIVEAVRRVAAAGGSALSGGAPKPGGATRLGTEVVR